MRPNQTKRLMQSGKPAVGLFVSSASPLAAETIGGLGFDWVLVDLQHGENNLANLSQMLTALSTTAATPFVRVPANDSMLIQRSLDLGAYGIVVPMVHSAAEAEVAVRAAKYIPRGLRSWGPIRGALYGGSGYYQEAGDETMVFAMLETAEGARRAGEVLAVDGIDGAFIGLNDLSISLGLTPDAVGTGEDLPPAVEEAVAQILAACGATGKIAGAQLYGPAAVKKRVAQGFRFVGLGTELRLLRDAALAQLAGVRG